MSIISPLCQLKGGCMGCCGYDFPSKEKIKEVIEKNTNEFNKSSPKTKKELLEFRDRKHPFDLKNGVCRNLIKKNECLFCPLHPKLNKEDLRISHCDINYLCKTAKEFAKWDKDKQKKFIEFINRQELTNIEYSIRMDKGMFLEMF